MALAEKCYSCASANFQQRWPRQKDGQPFFLARLPMIANESCDSVRSALPVVPCPGSVCVKFVVQEQSANRAVCSACECR